MDNINYKPNSHKHKARIQEEKANTEEKRVKKVVSGGVKVQKKSAGRKIADLLAPDDVSNVKSYLLTDVIVPTVKKLLFDTIRDGAEMLIFGEAKSSKRSNSNGWNSNYISYDRFSNSRDYRPTNRSSVNTRINPFEYKLDSRADAENVLMELRNLIRTYGVATISDLTQMLDITGEHTDNRYGWTNLENAGISRERDGWVLDLPKAKPIDY